LKTPEEAAKIAKSAAEVAAKNYAVVDQVMESLIPFLDAMPHEASYAGT
jgi:hypothetical protein